MARCVFLVNGEWVCPTSVLGWEGCVPANDADACIKNFFAPVVKKRTKYVIKIVHNR